MDYPLIVSLISIATTSIVGIILSNQIRSQKEIITNLNKYIETVDWEYVKNYYEAFKVPAEIDKERMRVIEEFRLKQDNVTEEFNELANYMYEVFNNLNKFKPGFAKDSALSSLPKTSKYFLDIWKDD